MIYSILNIKNTLGEKLAVFIEFKKRDPLGLRPQDDRESEGIVNDCFICHSEQSEESYTFIGFLTRRMIYSIINIKISRK